MRRIAATLKKLMPSAPAPKRMTSIVRSLPAPVGGWNARDPLAAMKPIDAVTLTNWFPRVADCVIRGGCADHVTGFASRAKTLAAYNAKDTGNSAMFAVTDDGIYDVTSAGTLGSADLARTAAYHCWCQMAVSGGDFLILVNGVDKPAYFDGAVWTEIDGVSTPALTGVTTTNLVNVNIYKRRLYFMEKAKLNFWYLDADAVGGALTEFLLGPLCARGGYTMAMGTWSLDGGNGPDDYACFVTSEGEVIVFTGDNPTDATNWTLKGVYYVGKPLGRRCFKKFGGDLVLITEYGAFPMSRVVQSQTVDIKVALTNKIEGAFVEAGRNHGDNEGWVAEILPAQGAFLFNVPTSASGTTAEQYVMNTTTKSWCNFTGWNASDLLVFNKELYYADATKIAKAWTGQADYGANIVADGQAAFNNFKDPRTKDWKLFRPMLRVNGSLQYTQGLAIDFDSTTSLSTATYSVISSAVWDQAMWDQAFWGAGLEVIKEWNTPGAKPGEYAAGLLRVATNSLTVQWAANEYLFEIGSVVT